MNKWHTKKRFLTWVTTGLFFASLHDSSQATFKVEETISPQSGLKAWCFQDPSTPIVSVHFAFRGGTYTAPPQKEGIVQLMSSMLDKGTTSWDESTYLDMLDTHGMHLEFHGQHEWIYGSLTTPKEELPHARKIIKAVMTKPRFKKREREESVQEITDAFNAVETLPDTILDEVSAPLLYGGDHPAGRTKRTRVASLENILLKDLSQFLKDHFAQDNLSIAVAGNLTPTEVADLIDDIFGVLPFKSRLAPVADITPYCDGLVHHVPYEQDQTSIVFYQPGLKRGDPDVLKASLLMDIMGSGDLSRLFRLLREEQACTYNVTCSVKSGLHEGSLCGGLATSPDKTVMVIETIRQQWRHMQENGVTEEELQQATKNVIENLPFYFSTSDATANYLLDLQLSGHPRDYLRRRTDIIKSITLDDINRVAKRLLTPDSLTFFVIGK